VAAAAWAAGNALFLLGRIEAALPWWFAFLVLTIAAERLEMTRLMKRRAIAAPLFHAAVVLLVAGATVMAFAPALGTLAFGAALVGLALWLATFDLARRTIHTEGFARYAAVALLGGYVWLAIGGVAWMAMPRHGPALRDAAVHAVAIGFVLSMIFAHAPLVVPVIARVRMRYMAFFYVPLAVLHVSLLVRLGAGASDAVMRQRGGELNAIAILLFAGTVVYAMGTRPGTGVSPRRS